MPFTSFQGFGAAARPVSEFPPLSEEEEQGVLKRILGTSLGGLQFAGQTLDKPGAAIRGLLAGRPDQLLNLIPFSDTLGITDPADRVYGRDLLEQAGVLESNTPGLDFGDVAGFGVDVLTDPLSYLNPLGALSKGGHIAKQTGLLDQLPQLAKQKNLATGAGSLSKRGMRSENTLGELVGFAKANAADDVARQQIDEAVTGAAGKLGYDLPDLLNQRLGGGFGFSSGPLGKSIALGGEARPVGKYGEVMDKIGQFAAYNPVSRIGSAGFSRAVRNQTDPILQQELRSFDPLKQAIEPQELMRQHQLTEGFNEAITKHGIDPADPNVTLASKAFMNNQLGFHKELEQFLPPEAQAVLAPLKQRYDDVWSERVATGFKHPDKAFQSEYGNDYAFRLKQGGTLADEARLKEIADLPGGDVTIEKLVHDPRLTTNKILTQKEKSRAWVVLKNKHNFTDADFKLADELAKRVRESNKAVREAADEGRRIPTSQRYGLKDMNNLERRIYKLRRKAIREARGQKTPLEGRVSRENIIANEVFRLSPEDIKGARKLQKAIREGIPQQDGSIFKIGDPRKLSAEEIKNAADPDDIARQITGLNALDKSRKLAAWVHRHPLMKEGEFFFGNHPIMDHQLYQVRARGGLEVEKTIHDVFARAAKPIEKTTGQAPEGYIKLDQAFERLGAENTPQAVKYFAERTKGRLKANSVYVPEKIVDSLAKTFKRGKYKTPFDDPKEVNALLGFYDSFTNLFKIGVTAHPAFHIRNGLTGLVQNVMSGAYNFSRGVSKYIPAAYKFSKGGPVKGLSKFEGIKRVFGDVTDEEATRKLLEAVDAYDLRGSRFDEIVEDVAGREAVPPTPWEKLNPDIMAKPGMGPIGFKTIKDTLGEGIKRPGLVNKARAFFDPTKMAGIGKGVVPEGVPLKAGEVAETSVSSVAQRQAGRLVEDVNRVSALLGYLDKGYDLASAIKRVKATHVDYKNLSKFERGTMRRIAPFYSFTRGIAENTAKELMDHPGGKLAQTIRASNSGREGGGYVPDYIGEAAAIPLGPDKYLSRLGLMHEGAFDPFVFKTLPGAEEGEAASLDVFRTPGRTMQKFLSMTNPAIKTPLELAFDQNLFTGRQHKDLYPYPLPGGLLRGDFVTMGNALINASPASRAVRTVRKLSDERKSIPERALAALGGVGITDVYKGAEQAKELDARRVTEELLGESPNIGELTKQYAFKGTTLTPTEKSLLRLSRTFDKRARERAKEVAKTD